VSLPIASLIFLIGYVNRDARRRGMNAGLWTFLVTILLPAWLLLGFVIYFLVREPLPYHCTQCGAMVSARFNYCPSCKYNVRPACEQCKREVGEFDRYCPHCGYETRSRMPSEVGR
jgi:RNA polymerase subunit RPABC4/transcription elongation factor Spt4